MKAGPLITAPAEEHLQQLASLIKQRESSLLLLLEEKSQRHWERAQWLLRECHYQSKENRVGRQIRGSLFRWVELESEESEEEIGRAMRHFWLRVKMVMKMSLERMKTLDLLSYSLFGRYQDIIDAINNCHDSTLGLLNYCKVEDMIRSRNRCIHELLHCGLSNSKSVQQVIINTSDCLIRFTRNQPQENRTADLPRNRENKIMLPIKRPFSDQSQRKGRDKFSSVLPSHKLRKVQDKLKFRKVQDKLDHYEATLDGVMNAKLERNLDKKRSIANTIESLFGSILHRNTDNQRIITTFILRYQGALLQSKTHSRAIPRLMKAKAGRGGGQMKTGRGGGQTKTWRGGGLRQLSSKAGWASKLNNIAGRKFEGSKKDPLAKSNTGARNADWPS